MINALITFSVRNKLIIGLFTIVWIGVGLWSLTKVPIGAVPDITNNQVQVITQAPSLGTSEIEQFVTYPVEVAMANLPGVIEIRSISRFGLSVVTVVFEDDMGNYLPRQLIAEKLNQVRQDIPAGFGEPFMGPITTGLGEIYQYTLEVDSAHRNKYTATELRTIQDWIVRRQMAMVEGVVEVNAFGGAIRQYEVAVNPEKLRSNGLTISDVFAALEANNESTGGAYIEKNHLANFIRGEGLMRSKKDIEGVVLKNEGHIPVTIGDVATVQFGTAVRYGAFTKNGQGEAVGGMILMLKGANTNKVIARVKERITEIQKSLPEGVRIEPFLDRSALIKKTTKTVSTNLLEGALIVIFVLVFLLGNWRGGLIVASTIPLSLLFAFGMMYAFGVWANLMSLGAIDFGIIVDGAVIIVESTAFALSRRVQKGKKITAKERDQLTEKSAISMMQSAFFGQLIVLIVFVPILFLEGVEGKMFQPMALTFMFAMLGVMLLCLTYVPMVSAWLLRPENPERRTWGDHIVRWLEDRYEWFLRGAMRGAALVLLFAVALLGLAVFVFSRMGGEFIPQLDEGDLAIQVGLMPGSSLDETIRTTTLVEKTIMDNLPEVKTFVSRIGVAEVPTDPMPMDVADCAIILKPKSEWTSVKTKDEMIEKMDSLLAQIPGVNIQFTQPIELRFNELLTGVREDIAIKIYGEDLQILADKAAEIGQLVGGVEGVADLRVEATEGLPQMTVRYNRARLAEYGLNVRQLNHLVKTGFAGGKAGVIFEGEKRFDLVVRLQKDFRNGLDDLKNLYVGLPAGAQVPLRELADISYQPGPMQISRDNTNRRTYVGINVRGRDVKTLVEEIQQTLDTKLDLPAGYYLRYGGAFENLERATERLKVVVPIALALIFVLIFFALRSLSQTAMIYVAIPFAAIGGVFSLWLRDMPFSISAGVGFIVLFGVAVLNGLVLINSWNDLKAEGENDLEQRIQQGARSRIRPILLTALTDILGFLPMAISTSAGAEVQRPLATVVIGGMVSATLLTLFVLPILYRWLESRSMPSVSSKMAVFVGLLLAFFALPQPSEAQEPPTITLEEALQRATENYPQLKAAQLEVQRNEALQKTALQLGRTGFFHAGEEVGNGGSVITPFGFQQQNIQLFGTGARRDLQAQNVRVAEEQLAISRLSVRQEVQQAYVAAFTMRRQLLIYERLDSIYQRFERAAKLRFEVEESSRLAYLAAQNQSKQIALQKTQRAYDYRAALTRLNQWLVSDTLYAVADALPEGFLRPLPLPDSLEAHPVFRLREAQIGQAERQEKAIQATLLPQLNLQYGIQQVDGQSGFSQYQIGLSLPLLAAPQRARRKAAHIQREIATEQFRQTSRELQSQYVQLRQQYEKWRASWQFYQTEALPLARQQQAGALLSFREGETDYISLIQNLKETVNVELQAQEALRQYLEARFGLLYFLE